VIPGAPEWRISSHGYEAVISAVGATLRRLRYDGRDLVVPFSAEEIRPVYRGALIAPWPNRIAGGRYGMDGIRYQLPLNEVERGHALHGLVHWIRWEPAEVSQSRVVLRHDLVPQDGYPFALQLRADFEVGENGLRTQLDATNESAAPVPYGCCPHPYLVAGQGRVDSWLLLLPAARRLEVDERLIPLHQAPVDTVDCDFRAGALIGDRLIDHAFTDLTRDEGGHTTVRLVDTATGTGVQMRWGSWAEWVQIHTADRPEPSLNRVGLAVEPMSCAPDAFNQFGGPPLLDASSSHRAQWEISASRVEEGTSPPIEG